MRSCMYAAHVHVSLESTTHIQHVILPILKRNHTLILKLIDFKKLQHQIIAKTAAISTMNSKSWTSWCKEHCRTINDDDVNPCGTIPLLLLMKLLLDAERVMGSLLRCEHALTLPCWCNLHSYKWWWYLCPGSIKLHINSWGVTWSYLRPALASCRYPTSRLKYVTFALATVTANLWR